MPNIAPVFDPVINYGAIFSIFSSVLWAAGLYFALKYKISRLEEKNAEAHAKAADDRAEVKDKLRISEAAMTIRLDKIEEKIDIHGKTLEHIAVQDERMKAFDLRLADLNDQIKTLVMATRWPRPDRGDRQER